VTPRTAVGIAGGRAAFQSLGTNQEGEPMYNIVIGGIMLIGGLSGELALIGTNSGGALAVLGGAMMGWGIFRMVKKSG